MTESATPANKTPATTNSPSNIGIPESFLAILVCPIDHSHLTIVPGGLKCEACSRVYPVENEIPNFVVDE